MSAQLFSKMANLRQSSFRMETGVTQLPMGPIPSESFVALSPRSAEPLYAQSPKAVENRSKTINFSNGTYQGEWLEGHLFDSSRQQVRQGRGVMRYLNGNEYSGEWRNDCFNGVGQYTWSDGRVLKGQFREDRINGEGVGVWPDGKRYEGEYVDDVAEGRGVVTLADGRVFDGRYAPCDPLSPRPRTSLTNRQSPSHA